MKIPKKAPVWTQQGGKAAGQVEQSRPEQEVGRVGEGVTRGGDHMEISRGTEAPMSRAELEALNPEPLSRGATLRNFGFFSVSASEVQEVKERGDLGEMAGLLREVVRERGLFRSGAQRLERMEELLDGMSASQIDELRSAYIEKYGKDPEVDIRSWDLLQPLSDLDDALELELTAALTGPRHRENARSLAGLMEKARAGELSMEDRAEYFTLLPMMGLWNAPLRPDAQGKDAMERTILKRAWAEEPGAGGVTVDQAMALIESKMPPPDLEPKAPRDKSVAVIVSSAGAQWQELMDWMMVMEEEGIHVQLFTPNGQPVAFQHDSMSVSTKTIPLGFGSPAHLDPQGPAGDVARKHLANTASAADFNPEHFGAVYAAGGLGFNEDVAAATPERDGLFGTRSKLTVNPNIASMMQKAVEARLPNIGICHGPTLYAATEIEIDGRTESLNKGMKTASLPPFEGYVGFTERKEPMFTYDVNTHDAMEDSGGDTSVLRDIADMARVVRDEKDGLELITGPGPQASRNLGFATLEALQRRW